MLVIAYEYPPSAGGGVQRVTKLVRYLPANGWNPYVITATPVRGRPRDESLLGEVGGVPVLRRPNLSVAAAIAAAIRPVKALMALCHRSAAPSSRSTPSSATGAPLSSRLMRLLFLDTAWLWSLGVPRTAARLHRRVGFDAVIASGPPHSALVAGEKVARRLRIPFVADVRDPWRTNPGYRWPTSPRRDARSMALATTVFESADQIVTVSQPITEEVRSLGGKNVVTVPNGFDPLDLPRWNPQPGPLRIAFMGRFYGSTDPTTFFDGVARVVHWDDAAADLVIDVLGQMTDFVRDAIQSRGLDAHIVYHGFLSHAEALEIVSHADAGLVALADIPGAEANYTGKLFEYLGIGLPVLLVGPSDGAAASLVREAHAGFAVPYADVEEVANTLERMAAEKIGGTREHAPIADVVARYDRRKQVAEIARLLDAVVGD
ncbi:MAG: glycosyltransferase family 4 protein [Coriobacteriia bacterium]|nr:glycosyltransferase family 4 protein [Coriobacteriia bacterium]